MRSGDTDKISFQEASWNRVDFKSKWWLFKSEREAYQRDMTVANFERRVSACSKLSSTYYGIASTGKVVMEDILRRKKLGEIVKSLYTWLPLTAFCYYRMSIISDKMFRIAGGVAALSADQADVRQSILRVKGRYDEAYSLIEFALEKKKMQKHTRGLLYIGLAECEKKLKKTRFENSIYAAYKLAGDIASSDPRQAVRIYRGCARLTKYEEFKMSCQKEAQKLTQNADMIDQGLKLPY
jgi:hypothetical protein